MEKEEITKIDENVTAAFKLMDEKGLTVSERMFIRNSIADWARSFNPDIKHDHKYNTFSHKLVKGYCFNKEEEAELIGALVKFIPNANPEKLIEVMSMLMKLFDIDSEYTWSSGK